MSYAAERGTETTIAGEGAPASEAAADKSPAYNSWIDKVRAQRQARREEHREAIEAQSPWEHTHYESLGKQREKMREALENRAEWREQTQRAHRRWTNPHGEFMKDIHDARRQLMEAQADNQRKQRELLWQQREQWLYGQMPHGWNNPWYYRGY